jgi:hypothetical protein
MNAFGNTWLNGARDLLHQFGLPLGLSYHLVRLVAFVLFAALALTANRRAPDIAAVTLGVFASMAALHFSGFLSMPYERHAIFLIPFSGVLTAIAVAHLLRQIMPVAGRSVVAGIVLAGALFFGAYSGLGRQTQELGEMLAHIDDAAPDVPVWVHGAGQPVFDVLAPRPEKVLAPMDSTSGPVAWQIRGGGLVLQDGATIPNPDYPKSLAAAASGLPALWLLFDSDLSAQEQMPFLEVAEKAVGPCKATIEARVGGLFFCARVPSVP